MLPAAGRNPARKRLPPDRFPTGKPIASKPEADLHQPDGMVSRERWQMSFTPNGGRPRACRAWNGGEAGQRLP